MDDAAARSSGIEQGGVDGGDFVADFPGGFWGGNDEAGFAEDGVVGDADTLGFAGAAGWVGAGGDATFHAVAAGDFFGEVPGGGAAGHDDFVEDVQHVVGTDGADA